MNGARPQARFRDIELHAMKWVVQNEPGYDADKTAWIRIR
jgi:hypothetical protein